MRRVLSQMRALEMLGPLRQRSARPGRPLVHRHPQAEPRPVRRLQRVLPRSNNAKMRDLAAIYTAYWAEQDSRHLWDFRDVIAQCQLLLERNDALRERAVEKFQHVIVDEYQDVDAAQVKLIAQLVQDHRPHPRLAVVGDPNQSIFSFRGRCPPSSTTSGSGAATASSCARTTAPSRPSSPARIVSSTATGSPPQGSPADRGDADVPVRAPRPRAERHRRGHGGGPSGRGAHRRGRRPPARATAPATSPSSCAAFAATAASSRRRCALPAFRTRWARHPTSRRPRSFASRSTPSARSPIPMTTPS